MRWERIQAAGAVSGGPGRRWGHTCNAVQGGRLLYVFGGYGEDNCQTNDVHVFDTVDRTWSKPLLKGVPPSPRDSHSSTAVGNKLFVFGGTDGANPLNDLHILDTSSNTWILPTIRGKGPDAREGHAASLVDKRLFIFGGCGKSRDNPEDTYYSDLYILDTEKLIWDQVRTSGTAPCARESHTCSSWRNKLIILGGEDSSDYYLSDVYLLDTDTLVWTELSTSGQMLSPRAGHSAIALGKNLFVFGGFADDRNLYDDLNMLNVETGIWSKVTNMNAGPSPRFSASGDCIDAQKGILAIVGGCNASLEALDDMYFLHTGLVEVDTFQAMITSVFPYGYSIETRIDGKLLRGIIFSQQSNSAHSLKSIKRSSSNAILNDDTQATAKTIKIDYQVMTISPNTGPINAAYEKFSASLKSHAQTSCSGSIAEFHSASKAKVSDRLELSSVSRPDMRDEGRNILHQLISKDPC